MAFETIAFEELRQRMAGWELIYRRGVALPGSLDAEDFANSYKIPETAFEFTQSFADDSEDLIVLFKTAVHLHAWQTRSGKEPADFSYYKVTKAILDDEGNVLDYDITGYVVTSV